MIEFQAGLALWLAVIVTFYLIGLGHSKRYDYPNAWYEKIGVGFLISLIGNAILCLMYILYLWISFTGQALLS